MVGWAGRSPLVVKRRACPDAAGRAWTEENEFNFDSESFHASAVWSQPKPLQKPNPPIMNAGGSPAAQPWLQPALDAQLRVQQPAG